MTAIAGIWHFGGKPGAAAQCARMLTAQAIYGPHDAAQWDGGSVALGRRLFRILPEDAYDRQPLEGGGGRFVLVADIRLDNRDDLARELGLAAERVRTMSDPQILLAAWERRGEACVDRLVGEYAFAVWDRERQRMVLARDPLGARSLHYHCGKDFFAFASMPKGLHALPEIPRAPDEERVAEFLALLPEYGPKSFFKDVQRVELGHIAVATTSGVVQRLHWRPERETIELADPREYVEGVLHLLDQAVRAQLRGAGNTVASHLSAGFDSSAVTSSAALQMAKSGGKVVAFTSVPSKTYDGRAPRGCVGDEGPVAANTAALYPNVEHVRIQSQAGSPFAHLDRAFYLYDRPVVNICNMVWHDAIDDAVRARKISVELWGTMGNMTLSYDGTTLLPHLMRTGRWISWLRNARGAVRGNHMRWQGVLNATFGPYTPLPLWTWLNRVLEDRDSGIQAYSALHPKRLKELDIERLARDRALDLAYRPRKDGFETKLWVMRRADIGNYYKASLGGWGIEKRDPFSDRRLVEFCLRIPEEQFLSDGVTKALARRALAGRVSPQVMTTRLRGLHAADWYEGLSASRDSLREELAGIAENATASAAIDVGRLERMRMDWPEGGWERRNVLQSYRFALLRAVSTGHFIRRASGSNR